MSENPFDAAQWRPVAGFDLTDITYHRHVVDGAPQPTVRVAFDWRDAQPVEGGRTAPG